MYPPKAKKIPKELTIHNETRIDNYYWMRDRENPAVTEYLNAENEYTSDQLRDTEKLQENIYEEIIGRIKQDDQSVPYFLNGYSYYSKFQEGKEYPIYVRKKGRTTDTSSDATEEILLDVNIEAKGHDYYEIGSISISPDNSMIAFSCDNFSRRLYTLKIKKLATGELLEDTIENTSGGITWAPDNNTLFYTLKDVDTLRSHKIYRHELGNKNDVEVYHEKDDTFSCYCYKTKSKAFIVIGSDSTLTSEHLFISANTPKEVFKTFTTRERGHEYSIEHAEGAFYILTNKNARNFKLMKCDEQNTSIQNWSEVIPHREDTLLESIELFKNHLVVGERSNGLTQIKITDLTTENSQFLDFGEPTYTAYISTNFEFDTNILRYGYTSLTTPNSVIEINLTTQEKTILKEQVVVGGYTKEKYKSERIFARARDGEQVPISLVYKKGTVLNDQTPLLLYAYGSYGYSIDAYFSAARLSLLDRGFVFAIAHIRGGEEMGRHWYDNGKLLKKLNTFHDYIDCAQHLIKINYTSPVKLCAMGGSAGGMLMGGVVNLEPHLFKAVIAAVPFVDCVTTMLDDTIPLTTGEYDEWGNPNNEEYYQYMMKYSPYDNIKNHTYPKMLITSGLHDSQVQYWEPTKWVAKLRTMATNGEDILLHTNMEAGHGGASGRFKAQKETAMEYAFLLKNVT